MKTSTQVALLVIVVLAAITTGAATARRSVPPVGCVSLPDDIMAITRGEHR